MDAGEPVKVGGRAQSAWAQPEEVADNDRTDSLVDRNGYLRVRGDFDPKYAGHRPISKALAHWRNLANKMGHELCLANSPVPIYNATLGGSLEVYERVDFRSLF